MELKLRLVKQVAQGHKARKKYSRNTKLVLQLFFFSLNLSLRISQWDLLQGWFSLEYKQTNKKRKWKTGEKSNT